MRRWEKSGCQKWNLPLAFSVSVTTDRERNLKKKKKNLWIFFYFSDNWGTSEWWAALRLHGPKPIFLCGTLNLLHRSDVSPWLDKSSSFHMFLSPRCWMWEQQLPREAAPRCKWTVLHEKMKLMERKDQESLFTRLEVGRNCCHCLLENDAQWLRPFYDFLWISTSTRRSGSKSRDGRGPQTTWNGHTDCA